MNAIRSFLGLVATAVAATAVSAQSFNSVGGLNPGDNLVGGITNTINVSGFNVPGSGSLTNFTVEVEVTWATRHTFAGDVILRLTGPNATTIDLVNRPGRSSVGGFGDDSNFGPNVPYTFRDSAPTRIIDVANTIGAGDDATGDIPSGFFRATNNTGLGTGSPGFSGEENQILNTSFGPTGNGDWTLFFSDNASGDYAAISGWVLRFVPVPEPTSVLAIGAGVVGLAGFVRRRFRREPVLA